MTTAVDWLVKHQIKLTNKTIFFSVISRKNDQFLAYTRAQLVFCGDRIPNLLVQVTNILQHQIQFILSCKKRGSCLKD